MLLGGWRFKKICLVDTLFYDSDLMALWIISAWCIQTEENWCCASQFQRLVIYFDIVISLNTYSPRHLPVVYIGIPFQKPSKPNMNYKREKQLKNRRLSCRKKLAWKAHFHFSNQNPKLKLYMYICVTFVARLFCVFRISRALFNAR